LRSRQVAAALFLGLGLPLAERSGAEVYLSQREALEQAFPDASRVEAETRVLDDARARAVESRAKARLETRLITVHTAFDAEGAVLGYAFIDVHPVRTLPEAFLVVLTPDGRVRSLRLLAFYEPPEYAAPERWLRLFLERDLDPSLRLGGAIHSIAGSTLTSRAVTSSVRRSLALYEVLLREDAPPVAAEGGEDGGGRTLEPTAGGR